MFMTFYTFEAEDLKKICFFFLIVNFSHSSPKYSWKAGEVGFFWFAWTDLARDQFTFVLGLISPKSIVNEISHGRNSIWSYVNSVISSITMCTLTHIYPHTLDVYNYFHNCFEWLLHIKRNILISSLSNYMWKKVKQFYSKLQTSTYNLVLTNWNWFRWLRCVFELWFE